MWTYVYAGDGGYGGGGGSSAHAGYGGFGGGAGGQACSNFGAPGGIYGGDGGSSYGSATAAAAFANTNMALPFSTAVTGLAPGIIIHFRAVASNSVGLKFGSNLTFAPLPVAPTVETVAATNVSGSGAVLQALVHPGGAATRTYFQIATTTNFGALLASTLVGSQNGLTAVAQGLGGFSPFTTYYFRALASNSVGIAIGSTLTFTTTAETPVVTTLPVSSVTAPSVVFNALVNPRLGEGAAYFEYGTNARFGFATAASAFLATNVALPFTMVAEGLLPGALYYYRAVATNSGGSGFGTNGPFTTAPLPPDAVTLPATGIGLSGATLNGSVARNGAPTRYWFEHGTDTNYGLSTLVTETAFLRFNGANQSGSTTNATALTNVSFTIEAWARRTRSNYPDPILTHGAGIGGSGTAFQLGFFNNNAFGFTFSGFGGGSAAAYTDTDWHHYAVTYNATNRLCTLYRDGVSIASAIASVPYHSTAIFNLGRSPWNGAWLGGDLREVRVWRALRTASNLTALMNVPANGDEPGLLACWHLDDGAGTTAYDSTTNATHALLFSAPAWMVTTNAAGSLSNLPAGTTHHFRLVATNRAGIGYGSDQTFTTLALPARATTLPATSVTTTGAVLHATVNPNGAPATWFFQIDTTTNFPSPLTPNFLPAGTNTVAVSNTVTGLLPATRYYFRGGVSNVTTVTYGDALSFTTVGVSGSAPQLTQPSRLPDGNLRLTFSSTSGATFTALGTSNPALPLAHWPALGPALANPAGSGQFQFTDLDATNHARRFYLLRSP